MRNLFVFCVAFLWMATATFAQVGINNDNSAPDGSAMLDVKATAKGFLPPRMTTAQRNTIESPVEGLVIYNTDEKALNVYNGTAWTSMTPLQPFACGLTISINHLVSGGVAPLNKTVAYGTVNGIPGEPARCWITRNLGAAQQATVVSDATEASAGWYFQFNRKQGYQFAISRTPSTAWNSTNDNLSATWEEAKDPCTIELGAGWRIPTSTEWTNVDAGGDWVNWNGPFGSALKIHAAGNLANSNGALQLRGTAGFYWSSAQFDANFGFYLFFNSLGSNLDLNSKAYGFSIRCLRD